MIMLGYLGSFLHFSYLTFFLFAACLQSASAQITTTITPDGSLGTTVRQNGSVHLIDGGTIRGPNQFHSFDRFDVGTGETARFTGPVSVANILGRVTGGLESVIDGRIQSDIRDANLYVLNPSGIMFGPNARLDVQGSFHVSTADRVRFEGGGALCHQSGNRECAEGHPPRGIRFFGGESGRDRN